MSEKNVVPFGKYRDRPIEELVVDRQYCEWLMAQPWFKTKYEVIYQIVVSGGTEPQDTPEHNALQARFLDVGFCLKFLDTLKTLDERCFNKDEFAGVKFECGKLNFDVVLYPKYCRRLVAVELKPTIGDDFPTVLRQIKAKQETIIAIRRDLRRYYREMDSLFEGLSTSELPVYVVAFDNFGATNLTLEQVRTIFGEVLLVKA